MICLLNEFEMFMHPTVNWLWVPGMNFTKKYRSIINNVQQMQQSNRSYEKWIFSQWEIDIGYALHTNES